MKSKKDNDIIEAFLEAVYPECTELITGCQRSEMETLCDATNLIKDLRAELARVERLAVEHSRSYNRYCSAVFLCERCLKVCEREHSDIVDVCDKCAELSDAPERGEARDERNQSTA